MSLKDKLKNKKIRDSIDFLVFSSIPISMLLEKYEVIQPLSDTADYVIGTAAILAALDYVGRNYIRKYYPKWK